MKILKRVEIFDYRKSILTALLAAYACAFSSVGSLRADEGSTPSDGEPIGSSINTPPSEGGSLSLIIGNLDSGPADPNQPGQTDSQTSDSARAGMEAIGGAGISKGKADVAPTVNAKSSAPSASVVSPASVASAAPGTSVACPTGSPTQAVDATPGWLGDLAFDSTNNQWLVVSHDGVVHGRIMSNNGQPVSAVFDISPSSQTDSWSPLAAFAPGSGMYLVVWVDYINGTNLYGRFVSSAGKPGTQFPLSISKLGQAPFLNIGGDRTSALRYDAANKKFVFTTMSTTGANHTVITTIDLNGNQGPVVEVGSMQNGGNWGPSVAVNPDKNEYCVAYDQRNAPKFAVAPVNASSLAAGPESTADAVTTNVDITYNPALKKYLLIYDAGYNVGVKGRFLNSCNLGDSSADFMVLPGQGYSSVASNQTSNTFAAIGQDGNDYGNAYSILSAQGAGLARYTLFATGSKNGDFLPVIRANTIDGTYAATSSRDYAMTRFVSGIGCGAGTTIDPPQSLLNWVQPSSSGESGSGMVPLAGTAAASITKVEILVNLKKVGDAYLTNGVWTYTLDTSLFNGGINLSALATDSAGATSRWTIRFNVVTL